MVFSSPPISRNRPRGILGDRIKVVPVRIGASSDCPDASAPAITGFVFGGLAGALLTVAFSKGIIG